MPPSAPHHSQNVVPLVIGQEVDGSVLLGQMKYFSFLAPADQRELTITATPTFGNPNLYINTGATECCNVRERGTPRGAQEARAHAERLSAPPTPGPAHPRSGPAAIGQPRTPPQEVSSHTDAAARRPMQYSVYVRLFAPTTQARPSSRPSRPSPMAAPRGRRSPLATTRCRLRCLPIGARCGSASTARRRATTSSCSRRRTRSSL